MRKNRNGKTHRIPLFKGLELKKLLCIGGVRFKVLKDYVRKSLFFYNGRKFRKKDSLSKSIQNTNPQNIWGTRNSSFWQWRRVKEWFSQFDESPSPEVAVNLNISCIS